MSTSATARHGWSLSSIGSVCTFSRGVSWKKSQERRGPTSGAVPVLRISNVQETLRLTDLMYIDGVTQAQQEKARIHEGCTLLVGSNGNPRRVGNCVYVTEPRNYLFASFLVGAKPANRDIDGEFLYRLLGSRRVQRDIWNGVQGSTGLRNIDLNALKSLCVLVPPLHEQRKIAAILSSVDEAIEKTHAVIRQIQVVKRGLMQELLTRGLPGRHTRFKKTEIGEMPEEWDLRSATAVCERIVVGIVVRPARHYAASGVPCLRSLNVREDEIVQDEMKYISHESNHQLRKSQLKKGDIVTVRTGYPGTSAVVPEALAGANCVDLIITTPGPRIRGTFLSRFINSERGRAAVTKRKSGLAQQHFNVGAMKAMLTPVPCLNEQDEISAVLRSSDQRLQAETTLHSALISLKSALMSVLLTGELRVNPDPE